ncbi:MAG: phosphoenolpyruvate synthase [Planctomycetota bacterium]|jgi:pyruvate,water dikinase
MNSDISPPEFILFFDQLQISDVPKVGGKNASLGEMVRQLSGHGVRVPNGFAITADAYQYFLTQNGIKNRITEILADLDTRDIANLQQRGGMVRQTILDSPIPPSLEKAITEAYIKLGGELSPLDVAVRSSATAEDLPDASFAGQQETYLNVRGVQPLLDTVRRCFASLFTDRAISYRVDKGFSQSSISLSVGVQRMVRSDVGASGVMFSIDTESGFRNAVLINAAYGLGENVVQGSVTPDEFYVFKPTLMKGYQPIIKKELGTKEFKLIYDLGGNRMTRNVPVPKAEREHFAITDDDILTLAHWACIIEEHYSHRRGQHTAMDIEWAKDGLTGELFIVQARPETIHSRKSLDVIESYHLDSQRGDVLLTGRSIGERIGVGKARIINDACHLQDLQPGEILVTDKTDPDWEPIMKRASAIITNRGGRTCHAAIVSRELGLPAIVGAVKATEVLCTGQDITVNCSEGETGLVHAGQLPFHREEINVKNLRRPRTRIMMNVAKPDEVFSLASIPNDGVGLARMEFIIGNQIQIHPLALIHFDQLTEGETKKRISELTSGYQDKTQYFVERLARGVGMIASAFYPKDVIVRLSDFKSNEYANLLGGEIYEPKEENPMIGFRGASRYYDPRYRAAFGLECLAMKRVREEMGLTNVKLMIPFCRTVEEGKKVLQVMQAYGLERGRFGLEIYVMCEIPSNVIAAEAFAEIFDGFSIGSNDLTQLTLGVDRDSEIVAHVFNERDPAMLDFFQMAIERVKKTGRKIGICGQAPSDFPIFAQFLVYHGIDSISLNPDTVIKTTLKILEAEEAMENQVAKADETSEPVFL